MPDDEELKKLAAQRYSEKYSKQFDALAGNLTGPRSTLTRKVAETFRRYYELFEKEGHACVPYTAFIHNSPQTLYKKVSDGMKWFIMYGTDEEKTFYARIKGKAKLSFGSADQGILITCVAVGSIPQQRDPVVKREAEVAPGYTKVKEDIGIWMSASERAADDLYDKTCNITEEEKRELVTFIEGMNQARKNAGVVEDLRYIVTLNRVRIMI